MKISIVGTGYVGLVTGAGLADLGNKVVCLDIDREKIAKLNQGITPFYEKGLEELVKRNSKAHRLFFTNSLEEGIRDSEIIFIAVGTPSRKDGEADLSQVIQVAEDLSKVMQGYRIIVVKSTVPVGTFELIRKVLSKNKKEGIDFDIVSNPEFLREGDAVYDFFHPTRIIIGVEKGKEKVALILKELLRPLNSPFIQTSIINAQMIKYTSNVFLASRISFINEIANICEKVGADIVEVVKGMSFDKRLGDGYLRAGIGFGGPCLIKDLKALIKMSEEYSYQAQHLKSILEKNEHQVKYTVLKLRKLLGEVLYGKVIGVLGLTFKPGTNDVRNSLSLKIIEDLQKGGAKIRAYDPQGMKEAKNVLSNVCFCQDAYEACKGSDALLVLTAWDEFKHLELNRLKKELNSPILIDGVNLFDPGQMRSLGFIYRGVGR